MSRKGQYIGGHTVVGPRSDFFVHTSKRSDENEKARADAAELKGRKKQELSRYASCCGKAFSVGKPYPKAPENLASFMQLNEEEFRSIVEKHPAYIQGREKALRKSYRIANQQKAKSERQQIKFIESCAISLFQTGDIPPLPRRWECQFTISEIKDHPSFIKKLRSLEGRKKKAQEEREKIKEKMRKIIVETKPNSSRFTHE